MDIHNEQLGDLSLEANLPMYDYFVRRYTLFRPRFLTTPVMYDISQITLPKFSTYHFVDLSGLSTGPQYSDSLLTAVPGVKVIDHIRQLWKPISTPIKISGVSPDTLLTEYRRHNRMIRPTLDPSKQEMDDRGLIIYNYSLLAQTWRYATNFRAEYFRWQWFKRFKFDQRPLHFLRMTQYGIAGDDGDRVEKILQLETLLSAAVTGVDQGKAEFDSNKIDMRKIYQIFGLLPENDDGSTEIDPERQQSLVNWLAYRFKPVYLAHISALQKVAKTKDLNKADEVIKTRTDMKWFLTSVAIGGLQSVYDNEDNSPFDGSLDKDADDVLSAIKRCQELAEKLPDTETKASGDEIPNATETDKKETANKTDIAPVNKDAPKPTTTPEPTAAAPRFEDTPTNTTSTGKVDKNVTDAMVSRAEAEAIQLLNTTIANNGDLLSKAVERLSNIDKTLLDISKGVVTLANRASNPPAVAAVEPKTLPGYELDNMSGADLRAMMSPNGQVPGVQKRTPRPNVSPTRKLAMT